MIGRLLSGRYRVEAVVGTGGMAVVYRAYDQEKDCVVAIKLLRSQYESDMEFVRRFSMEAEAAAKMAHENIVNMLDVGIDGEVRYIVMEYVDGYTLKQMISREGRIHPDVALRMTLRILAAVDHAHRNGIVHRDIKPQNILVDKSGRVKVADFGIARLKTAQAAMLEASGEAMGSVHYLSPEQARGELADEQSDLYSVGIVLYEMLTGDVPFDGDTPEAVALKHVSEPAKSMRFANAHVSKALDEVVMRALCKEKERRYRSAAEMAADLRKTLTHPKGGFVRYPESKQAQKDEKRGGKQGKRKGSSARKRRIPLPLVFTMLFIVIVLAFGAYYHRYVRGNIPMPSLLGASREQAVEQLQALGIVPNIVDAYSEEYEAGTVMQQSSDPGVPLRRNARPTLTISKGSQWFYMQDMVGWEPDDALAYLNEAGVQGTKISYVQSEDGVGKVLALSHGEGWCSRDEVISIRIGGQSVAVPVLTGLTLEGARALLEAEGLKLGIVTQAASADARANSIILQSIAPYTQVLVGTSLDLSVCSAHEELYTPLAPLTLVVPLDGVQLRIELIAPSGALVQAYTQQLSMGTHTVFVESSESGVHTVLIYVDDVLFERLQLDFS